MSYDLLTTSGINSLVNSYVSNERFNRIYPLETRKTKYSKISDIYSNLLTKVDALKSKMSTLKATGTSSAFAAKNATSSNTTAVTVNAGSAAANGNFSMRVNQLAKYDLIVSETKSSDSASGIAAGTSILQINSGDYNSRIEVVTDGTETYKELMEKIRESINSDKATIKSNGSGSYNNSGTLSFDVDGTSVAVDYDYSSGKTYSEVVDDLVIKINENVNGVTAENVDGNLQITVNNSSDYITISDSSGTLASDLGFSVAKEMGASGLASSTVFTQTTDNSKFSLTAKNSGYTNRLIISDVSGNLLDSMGLTAAVLADRTTKAADDLSAGYMYLANSSTSNELNSKITFNGINLQRDSNSITDIVTGVTLNLKSIMSEEDTDVTIDVANDVNSIKTKIEDFISSFNEIYTYIKTNATSNDGIRGVLLGDSSASSLLSLLSSTAYSPISGLGTGTINSLSEIGITFNASTGLSISDSNQLTNALEDNIEEVDQMFTSENGIASTLYNRLLPYTGYSGYLAARKNSLQDNIESINDSITLAQSKIDKRAESLRIQYIQLQTQLSELLASVGDFSSNLLG